MASPKHILVIVDSPSTWNHVAGFGTTPPTEIYLVPKDALKTPQMAVLVDADRLSKLGCEATPAESEAYGELLDSLTEGGILGKHKLAAGPLEAAALVCDVVRFTR